MFSLISKRKVLCMMNLNSQNFNYKGVLVEVIQPIAKHTIPTVYNLVLRGGGAVSAKLQSEITGDRTGLKYLDIQIAILQELVDILTQEELTAILEHEMTHILNGDLEAANGKGKSGMIHQLDYELAADQGAVQAVGAAVTLAAQKKVERFTMSKLLKTDNDKLLNFFTWAFRTRIARKRFKALADQAKAAQ